MAPKKTPWPTHPDGRPKKMGELTPQERAGQFAASATRVRAELEQPGVQKALGEYLDGTSDAQQKH